MKTVFFSSLLFLSMHLNAAEILNCTTPGDALDSVVVTQDGDFQNLTVGYMSEETETFRVMSYEGTTIIAAKDPGAQFGGGLFNAILMNIDTSKKFGTLALNGNVYFLECR